MRTAHICHHDDFQIQIYTIDSIIFRCSFQFAFPMNRMIPFIHRNTISFPTDSFF